MLFFYVVARNINCICNRKAMKGTSMVAITKIIQNRDISAVADSGFFWGGRQLQNLFFYLKLHENERIWTPRVARPWRPLRFTAAVAPQKYKINEYNSSPKHPKSLCTHTVNVTIFIPFKNGFNKVLWCCLHVNNIKNTIHKNSDVDGTCKWCLSKGQKSFHF